jgi:hypothetical protein
MGLTNFPDGISGVGGAAIPGYVSDTSGNAKFAAGTAIITAGGSVTVGTGLTTVNFAMASAYGLLAGTADFDQVSAQPTTGGSIFLRSQSGGGTASVSPGTATWWAVGT